MKFPGATRRLLKIPKWALVISVFVASTIIFLGWYSFFSPRPREIARIEEKKAIDDTKQRVVYLQDKTHRLFLANGDLYDAETGNRILTNWLKDHVPSRLFYDSESHKLYGRLEKGFARFALDGSVEATLGLDYSPAFSDDLAKALYCKNGDIWTADVDWKAFQFTNERQVTRTGEFERLRVSDSILLSSPRYLILKNKMKAIQVDMDTGAYKPSKIPGKDIQQRRSPDCTQCFAYDVETDKVMACTGLITQASLLLAMFRIPSAGELSCKVPAGQSGEFRLNPA